MGSTTGNEEVLREVNDRIEEVSQAFSEGDEDPGAAQAEFLCECGDPHCTESLRMSVGEYEEIRRDKALLIVSPEHEDESKEDVVAHLDRYVVVRRVPEESVSAKGDAQQDPG
jgi:hypothetical protein